MSASNHTSTPRAPESISETETTHTPRNHSPVRTLVTGGGGFIGSHLVDLLLARGDNVVVIDDFSTGRHRNLDAARRSNGHLRVIEGDIRHVLGEIDKQCQLQERFDQIYHLAAAVGVKLVVDQPIRCIETNVEGTAVVLRYALEHGPHEGLGARTLIASSSEVYGKSDKSPFQEDDDVTYGPTVRSRWSYAASKAIDEYLALAYHAKHGLPVVVARFFNTVGPRQVGNYGMVLPNFVTAALNHEQLRIYGDGQQTRCFCDVRDVVEALPKLLQSDICSGRVFNVGSDHSISIEQLAQTVVRVLGSQSTIVHVPYEQAYSSGFEDLRKREPDLTRIRSAIGFKPTRTLEQTIIDLAEQIRADQAIDNAWHATGRATADHGRVVW